MDTKKVETIRLPYLKHDGKTEYGNFMAELNDATFGGSVSSLEGTFSGTLTADAINAAGNLNIAGESVARTTVSYRPLSNKELNGFNDKSIYKSVHEATIRVPNDDYNGGNFSCVIQYTVSDERWDNDFFPCRYRILLNGVVLFQSKTMLFGALYRSVKYSYHEILGTLSKPGEHVIDLQYAWDDMNTNVYPVFRDITFRLDYIRK